tara:strand:+ start:3465 stop:3788 length:324 start_codon:yes stop_codon:yes gene_type:complete
MNKIINKKKNTYEYQINVTRFSNTRTFLSFVRTCSVFVAIAIYLKNKYIFILSTIIVVFGTLEYILINKMIGENKLTPEYSSYFNTVIFYSLIFIFIFMYLFYKPPF